uniref:Putative capsid protein n=1 Tax=viral metagenome TaxID=1070528 RepID=A0A6M3L2M9_9ZZZZ
MAAIHETSAWSNHVTLRGIDALIFEFEEKPAVGRKLFNVKSSSEYREHSLTVGGVGLMPVVAEGEAISYVAMNEGFLKTYTHVDYGSGMRVTRRMKRDDLYGTMAKQARELGRSWRATEETLLANHLNNAFSSGTGGDGQYLCVTTHVREDGTAASNTFSSAADLSQTPLEQAMIDFSDFRDGGSKRITIDPANLVVPKELKFKAIRLVGSTHNSEDDTNAINPIKGMLEVVDWNYLTDSDAWFLLAAKGDHDMTLYDREKPWTDYEVDFDTKDNKVTLMAAQSSGWNDWKGIFGTAGA